MSDEIPYGYCKCGCGQKTKIAHASDANRGYVKGEPYDFLHGHKIITPVEERFWDKVDKRGPDDCWEWTAARDGKGYGMLRMGSRRDNTMRLEKAHRISYELHYDEGPGDLFVCHTCDNPPCVNPHHLFLGTNDENLQDMFDKDRSGEKLNATDVEEIRERYAGGETQKSIADDFPITRSYISMLVNGKRWKHNFD